MLNYNLKNACWSLLMLVLLAACTKDDASSSKVELFSFGPSGIQHGDKVKFIGKNLDKVTSVVLPLNIEIQAADFATRTSTLLEVVVPDEAVAGKVTLKTPQGDIETKTMLDFLVPVTITSVTPEAKPGTNISIKGTLVNWIESVTFSDNLKVTDFVSKSTTEVVVTVPMTAKTGSLVFATGGTKPLSVPSKDPLTVTLPVVTALAPASVKHAENLTLTGTALDLVTSIAFPDKTKISATGFVSQSESQIVVAVPVTATDGALTLTVASGVTVVPTKTIKITLPIVTAFTPSDPNLQIPGATLTMTGTDLNLVKSIKFPNVTNPVTTFTLNGTTQIDVVIPAAASGGTMSLVTIHDFTVPVNVPFGNQLTLAVAIFDETLHSPFGLGGGWGGATTDAANTDVSRVGVKAVKATFAGGYGGASQFGTWGNSPLSTAGNTFLAFSIYGGTGTGGKNVLVNVGGGTQATVSVVEGSWKDVKIPLSSVGSPTAISELSFQDSNWSGTVYIDQVGLK